MTELAVGSADDLMREALQFHRLGRLDHAVSLYRKVLESNPMRADVAHLYGLAEVGRGEMALGIQAMILSLNLKPGVAQVEHDLAAALNDVGQIDRAIEHFKQAIAIKPDFVEAHVNLAGAFSRRDEPKAAVAELHRARELAPNDTMVLFRLGRARSAARDWDGAAEAFEACLAIDPEHADARYYLADLQLTAGQFNVGWDNYEARWFRPKWATEPRPFSWPKWNGECLEGRTILVWGEQGVGEEILFASMIPDVMNWAGHVLVECDPRLRPLFERSFPGVETVGRTYPASPRTAGSDIDLQSASGSLGRWLRVRTSDFRTRAYLRADAEISRTARARYDALGPGPKIGIAWRSLSPLKNFSSYKSSPIEAWQPVLARPDPVFVNLQYGECNEALDYVAREWGVRVHVDAEIDQMTSLDDFAAQIDALDLIITTSNTTAHVAGALGKEVWVVLPVKAGWRWSRKRCDSLWYPEARLFRQKPGEDWARVLTSVGAALDEWQSQCTHDG